MLIPFQWIGLFATVTVFAAMFALGLMLGREQIAAKLEAPLGRAGSFLLLALGIMVLVDVPPIIAAVGWTPMIAGVAMTVCALALGLGATMVAFLQWRKRR